MNVPHASCSNIFGLNNFVLIAPDQGSVDVKAASDTEHKNECRNVICANSFGTNSFTLAARDQASIEATTEQDLGQGNKCDNAICANSLEQIFSLFLHQEIIFFTI